MPNNTATKYTTKQVIAGVFVDNNQKRFRDMVMRSHGYLTTFADGEQKEIAKRYLDKIDQAICDACEEALAEGAEHLKDTINAKKD